ncbi:lytic transglycosylase domain-containing protein [Bradyrhizobium sp.]|uniref:lytic transglycosylase domain-containing protein n=1 Tax=Bradyrhizobium sp. TaxID=376 RepID=UPI0039E2BF02
MLWDRARVKLGTRWACAGAAALLLASVCAHAEDGELTTGSTSPPIANSAPDLGAGETVTSRAEIQNIIAKETAGSNLPADIAEAVVFVESGYNSSVVGSVGEVGLMQVRPETAAMLGFRGTTEELAKPAVNIHYGVLYLARAWRLADGDLCRALMKYRAGHGEETMTPRSQVYCNRARNHLVAVNSPLANGAPAVAATLPTAPLPAPAATVAAAAPTARASKGPAPPRAVYARFRQGTAAASRAYWAAQEARVGIIKARIEAKWKKVASR